MDQEYEVVLRPLEKTFLWNQQRAGGHSVPSLMLALSGRQLAIACLVLKGALGGGLDIPHSDKRFAGFKKDDKQLDAEVHRKYIFGGHVSSYMTMLMGDEPEKYQMHFSDYIKRGLEPDSMEELYKKVHAASRVDPTVQNSTKEPPKEHKSKNVSMLMKMLEDIPVNFLIMLDDHLLRFPQVHPLAVDIVVKLLTFDPRQRITAQDLRTNFPKAADQIGKWIQL